MESTPPSNTVTYTGPSVDDTEEANVSTRKDWSGVVIVVDLTTGNVHKFPINRDRAMHQFFNKNVL